MRSHPTPPRRIVLCLPLSYAYARGIARGAAAYFREHTDWLLHIAADGDANRLLIFLRSTRCDGLISMIADAPSARRVGKHVDAHVLVSMRSSGHEVPRVVNDDEATGRMAAEFFLAQGRRHFAFVRSLHEHTFATLRLAGFSNALARAALPPPLGLTLTADASTFRSLPPGTAVLAENDETASAFCLACAAAGVDVPGDLAVLGVDDDETHCALARPPLSSIAIDSTRIGRRSAERLVAILTGLDKGQPVERIPPLGVRARESTGPSVERDPLVARASAWIIERLRQDLSVDQIARAAGVSRRTLEYRFKAALGLGVHRHLTELRLARAQEAFANGELLLKEIALACGFSDERAMKRAFRALTGRPPSDWRRRDADLRR